ncbi:MAG: hypothetical protein DRJ03_27160 [Chloroflexi bacterium]|nr:MAG: hypothetical protein DRJ03_27160 [Chloroflexota bacterium]RLI52446.1 MAG: hypothetical protein DRP09_17915 [Candidatus Thorarchaeota archaeon]
MLADIATEVIVSIAATLIVAALVYIYRRAITIKLQAWLLRQKGIGIVNVYPHRMDARPPISKMLQSAQAIQYMGIQGLDIITHREVMFSDLALSFKHSERKQQNARFLILDPESCYTKSRSEEIGQSRQEIHRGIKHSLEDLEALNQNIDAVDLEVRLYDCVPIWNLLFLDDILFLAFYLKGVRGPNSLCLEIQRPSPLFLAFEKYFDEVWEEAKPFQSGKAEQ